MQRVSVIGNSGSGKSTLARRLAERLGATYVELDALFHQPGWTAPEPEDFLAAVDAVASTDRWVIDGNYRAVTIDGPVWRRADTIVWLDLPRRLVIRQITSRSVRRAITREELWNGNREPVRNLVAWDPERSVIRWAWTRHGIYEERYCEAKRSAALTHVAFVRLRSHREAATWLAQVAGTGEGPH